MEFEKEITVEINCSFEDLIVILENNYFKLQEEYEMEDLYFINKNDKTEEDCLQLLNKCVLLRHIIEKDKDTKMLTYKYKEYNQKQEIIKQGKIKCGIDNLENAKELLEKLNFEPIIHIYNKSFVYANDTDELVIQCVNDKHIYIEIEEKCYYLSKTYESIKDMKRVIKKYEIPIKDKNYFVKKAEIELKESHTTKKLIQGA